jgi:histidine triad (HIT) family protein
MTSLHHAPDQYACPFCQIVDGLLDPTGVVEPGAVVTTLISKWWFPRNPGHVLVVPNEHVENVYAISDELLGVVYTKARRVAIALKEIYGCDGTSMRQHNEPAGDQDVWHFHVHVLPRYRGDDLYLSHREHRETTLAEREPYATRLREYFQQQKSGTADL